MGGGAQNSTSARRMKTRVGGRAVGGGGGEVKGALLQTIGVSELKRAHVLEEPAQQRGGIHHPLHRLSPLCFQNRGEKKSQGQDLLLHSQQIESNSADAGGKLPPHQENKKRKKSPDGRSCCCFLRVQQREVRNTNSPTVKKKRS